MPFRKVQHFIDMHKSITRDRRKIIAFLFLGETLLIPHLHPIVEAIAQEAPDVRVDIWIATSTHERLIVRWLNQLNINNANVRIRRVPGFRVLPGLPLGNVPELPPKPLTLLRLMPRLITASAIVCAEQTSLWIPALIPFFRDRFVKTSHGVGSMSARDDRRRRAARLLLVPSEAEKQTYTTRGIPEDRLIVTGYIKSAFRARESGGPVFASSKPVVVYAPHWQQHRSSWWSWGRELVALLAAQDRYNVILAPHQRLVEKDPQVREVLASVSDLPHIHVDLDSFAMVDGSYMAAADIYLGDTSSQVMEFLLRPRPCVFLNPENIDWRATDDHDFWTQGQVVKGFGDILPALDRAFTLQPSFEPGQRRYIAETVGETGPGTALRAAQAVLSLAA